MSLKHRLKKLEKAIRTLPCSICREWWQQPVAIRDETDPPVPRDPDFCPSRKLAIFKGFWVLSPGFERDV